MKVRFGEAGQYIEVQRSATGRYAELRMTDHLARIARDNGRLLLTDAQATGLANGLLAARSDAAKRADSPGDELPDAVVRGLLEAIALRDTAAITALTGLLQTMQDIAEAA